MEKRGRTLAIFLLMGLCFALVAVRLVHLQVFQKTELTARAERQQERLVKLESKRGTIYDRMGRELAVSVDVDSVYAVPSGVTTRGPWPSGSPGYFMKTSAPLSAGSRATSILSGSAARSTRPGRNR